MYYDKFFPFHVSYAGSGLYESEEAMEQEFELMKSWYPRTARLVQAQAEQECRLLDYEGSPLYDEYPDKRMLEGMCGRIRKAVEQSSVQEETAGEELSAQGMQGGFLDDLIGTVVSQEISRRRCRRFRCRNSYGPGGWGPGRPGGSGGWGPGNSGGWNPGNPGRPGGPGGPGGPGRPGGWSPGGPGGWGSGGPGFNPRG